MRAALVAYAVTAGVCLAVVLGLFERQRNRAAEDAMLADAARRAASGPGKAQDVEQTYMVQEAPASSKYPFLKHFSVEGQPLADKEVWDAIASHPEGPVAWLSPGPPARVRAIAPLGAGRTAVLVLRPEPHPAPLPAGLWLLVLGGAVLALAVGRLAPRARHLSAAAGGLGLLAYGRTLTPDLPWLIGAGVVVVLLAAAGMKGYGARLAAGLRAHRAAATYVGPALIGMAVLVVVPLVVGVGLAFFDHRHGAYSFVGLGNFVEILSGGGHALGDPLNFWFTLAVTLAWTFVNVALHATIGLGLALVLRQPWLELKAVYRVLLIVPWAVPNYITALIWKGMFHQQYGAVNHVLGLFGIAPVSWFSSFAPAFAANVVTNTWLGFPFMMVICLGALQSIPADIYEAADVDGASRWQKLTRLTLPLLRPALFPAITLGCIWTFNQFNIIYLVSRGEPGGATNILVTEAYRWAFERGDRYGLAAAYAVLIFVVLLGWSWVNARVARAAEGIYE
jgi:ABC-type sugar transport system permease subunit